MYPEFPATTDLSQITHPGTVTFVGPDGAERAEPADGLPVWLKFAPGADGTPLPVVRVVRLTTDRGYTLRSYGAEGQLLWVGLTAAAPTLQSERLDTPAHTTRRDRGARPPLRHSILRDPATFAEPKGWF